MEDLKMKKSTIIKSLVIAFSAIALVTTISLSSIKADSLYDEFGETIEVTEGQVYTLEEMLNYAIQSEYLALAEYEAIIDNLGAVRPFTNIIKAESVHIQALVTLFETFGYEIPENNASEQVVIPETISQAIATAIESEETTISTYQLFLSQEDLPEDVRDTFEYLLTASENHLTAFQKDRTYGYGQDIANKVKNMFRYRNGQNGGNGQGQRNKSMTNASNCQ